MLITSGGAVLFLTLHMPQYRKLVKRKIAAREKYLRAAKSFERFYGDFRRTLRMRRKFSEQDAVSTFMGTPSKRVKPRVSNSLALAE